MNLLINESQVIKLLEQVKINQFEKMADDIWNSVSGIGTDEEKIYDTIKNIKNLNTLGRITNILYKKYKQNFYDIVNEPMEFTKSEKQEIVNILNSNGIKHILNDDGNIQLIKQDLKFKDVSTLVPSEQLYSFLRCEEGKVGSNCKPMLNSYRIPGDIWTIGYGHTGDYAKPNSKIDPKTAENLLKKDVLTAHGCVSRIFNEWKNKNIDRKITQSMLDTLTSLAFNAGCGSLRGTSGDNDLIDYIRRGEFLKASEMIPKFNSNKPGFSGLKTRREKEKKMFCKEGGCS